MSQKSKNGSILSFFKPKVEPASQPLPGVPSRSPQLPAPSSSPARSSQIGTPVKASRGNLEIGASDDDDGGDSDGGESDDSLADLSTLLGHTRPDNAAPARAKQPPNPYATPRAKRTAVVFHSSPLTFMPKHKFDLKALAKDARQDDATKASSLLVKAAQDSSNEKPPLAKDKASDETLVEIVKDNGGHDAQKVLRAVQRAEPGQSQLRYCFFRPDYVKPDSTPAPKEAATGPWRLLSNGSVNVREQHLVSGLLRTVLIKTKKLPDELFQWMLDELCVHKSLLVRQEYLGFINECHEQVERLLTPQRLKELFVRLGAADDIMVKDSELTVSSQPDETLQGTDWTCVQCLYLLLGLVARHLSLASVTYSIHTLMRMSMDRSLLCTIDALPEFEHAVQRLLDVIPKSSWSSFCFDTCSLLHSSVKVQCIRINALLCMPVSNGKTHDLRRRLAIVFLFGDPALGRHHPDDVFTIRGAIESLSGEAFAVGPKTDFAELRASIVLLDMAIDYGSFIPTGDAEDERKFNEEIDELALKFRGIWRKINDSGMRLARTEAKSVIEWVQQRLSHSLRTRRKAKSSVFDVPGQRDDPFLPRQQDYMSKFLKKKPEATSSG